MNNFIIKTLALALCVALVAGCGSEPEMIGIDPLGLMASSENKPRAEVDLGSYEISIGIKDSFESMYVSFTAVGIVPEDRKEDVEKLIESHQTRLRDRVNTSVQNISMNQLQDPRFVWLKSELTRCINDELKIQDFKEIVFSGFSLERR